MKQECVLYTAEQREVDDRAGGVPYEPVFSLQMYRYARTLYGLSANQCVLDIVQGEVAIDAVHLIISCSAAATPDEWEQVIASRRASFWLPFPDEAERVFRQLLGEGKVSQPLLNGVLIPSQRNGVWVTDPGDIEWVDVTAEDHETWPLPVSGTVLGSV